jgi:hypothetical protein
MKNTPAGRIAMIGSVAVDNLKNLYDLAKGNISKEEALDRVANTTVTTVAGIAAAEAGVGIGAAIGTVFGPVGTFWVVWRAASLAGCWAVLWRIKSTRPGNRSPKQRSLRLPIACLRLGGASRASSVPWAVS